MTPLPKPARIALEGVVGAAQVRTDPGETAAASTDWTRRFVGATPAIVRPGSTDEVVGVIEVCAEHGIAVVTQGGNTGLVAGATPLHGELVLSTSRLVAIDPVDELAGTVVVGAGATLGDLQRHADAAGWRYAVDLGARDSATVGGTVATNAGGVHVLRYRSTRAQLLGVEAVTGAGQVVGDLRGLAKDNSGYHLPSLLCGSEGTLAVITRVCVRLVRPPPHSAVALLAFADVPAAVRAVPELRRAGDDLQAIEVFLADGLDLVCNTFDLAPPFGAEHAVYLLAEVAGTGDLVVRLGATVAGIEGVADAAVADDSRRRAALWRYRELHTDAIATLGPPHKFDVTIPQSAMETFVKVVRGEVAALRPQSSVWLFGHIGDGNVHVNVTGLGPDDDEVASVVFDLTARCGGSISAEHGIGQAKRRWLHLNRTPAEIELFGRIKAAFDPSGILNPHTLLQPGAPVSGPRSRYPPRL